MMRYRSLQIWVPVLLLLAACAPSGADPDVIESGISGQVLIGPMCPVVKSDTPCPDQPYQATIAIVGADGRQVTEFQTDAQGNFQVPMPPGSYTLVPKSPGRMPQAAEQAVTVASGQFTTITITYDSGIR